MTTAPIDLPDLDDDEQDDDAPATALVRFVLVDNATPKFDRVAALAEDLTAALAGDTDGLVVLVDEHAAGSAEPVFRTLCRAWGTPELYRHGIPGLLVLDEAPTPQERPL